MARFPIRPFWLAAGLLALAGFCAGFTHIWNFDIFWHLAGGKWMLEHGQVLRTDPFSIDPQPHWMNIHWGFQLVVAALYQAGGFGMLSLLKGLLALATPAVLALVLRRRVHWGWLAFCGSAMLLAMLERVRLRPELFTMLYTLLALWLVDSARRGEGVRRLWALVPLMVVWVNMHGLYFFGLVIMWAGVGGTLVDRLLRRDSASAMPSRAHYERGPLLGRSALLPMVAATLACLVSPWPVEAALHPFTLFSRVSGQAIYFTFGVAELQPTMEALGRHWEAVGLTLLAAAAMLADRRRVPSDHWLVLAFFAAIGLMARRNVGLIAPAGGYLLALHGQEALRRLGERLPRLARAGGAAAGAALLLPAFLSAVLASEALHRWQNTTIRFGPGLLRQNYPVDMARFLAELPAEGDVLCENFGDSAVFQFYSYPRRKTFMDGRLEAHPMERFVELNRIRRDLRTPIAASLVDLPPSVRFVVVSQTNRLHLSALMQSQRFRLLYIDPPAVCFARTDWPVGSAPARASDAGGDLPAPNFAAFDRPLDAGTGLVGDFPTQRWRWYRQNPQPLTYWAGSMFLYLGLPVPGSAALGPQEFSTAQQRSLLLAIRYLNAALVEDIIERPLTVSLLAEAHQQWAAQFPLPADAVPVDVNQARALRLYNSLDLGDLRDETLRQAALARVLALVQAQRFERAYEAAGDLLDHLPPAMRVNPPLDFLRVRDTIGLKLRQARGMLADVEGTPLQRARLLMTRKFGLDAHAIRALREAPTKTEAEWLYLGDLLLGQGEVAPAREAYRKAGPQRSLREALCDWVEGDFAAAAAALAPLKDSSPLARVYLSLYFEQTGKYPKARELLARATTRDEALQALIERTRNRILQWE
ncbi:MAG: hypothetical protein BWX88_01527 [Planctomycetes bacterium ADurb.Bin126]|nr:MAG: hypothetical protein BWX88_01527 [Planctomycetes bacterium ADurb.Bin126]HOD84306.1 hypothetical protein [Phycisphaerae bacterium]HQL73580.1 hypothetical protein [Phycisphaerae bacterium]